ncbi:MAG: GNAT family N-acetyltransferase [Bacteroidales bacterium]|nr:GNAT family N-acetyltransferase [Bacteroidales bacterium]
MICEQRQDELPLFQQYWWMETVCRGKSWDVAMAYKGDTLQGVMPFHYGRKLGMTYLLQPQLTQFSGPHFFYPEELSDSHRLEFEKEVAGELIRQMESIRPSYCTQCLSPSITNWLPFYWNGYSQTTRYTYRIDDISDLDSVFANFDRDKRQRKIKKYLPQTSVRFDMSPESFASFHVAYWQSKGQKDILPYDLILNVCSEAIARHHGFIASLHDNDGNLLMARFVAYDSESAYSLMSAYDPQLHRSGHSETLHWYAIQYLSGKTKAYDFEGSMDEGIEYFYRSFGAKQVPFFEISKSNSRLFKLLMRFKKR